MNSPLFVDLYAGDMAQPNWAKVSKQPEFFGAILKATEGLYYFPAWFTTNWGLVASDSLTGREYGQDWFRGTYHFLKFNQDGKTQAEFYLKAVDEAGGWGKGDLWPIVDVELGGEKNSNQNALQPRLSTAPRPGPSMSKHKPAARSCCTATGQ